MPFVESGVPKSRVFAYMVIVAELVKRLIVVQEIVGSSPIFHTTTPEGRSTWPETSSCKLNA